MFRLTPENVGSYLRVFTVVDVIDIWYLYEPITLSLVQTGQTVL